MVYKCSCGLVDECLAITCRLKTCSFYWDLRASKMRKLRRSISNRPGTVCARFRELISLPLAFIREKSLDFMEFVRLLMANDAQPSTISFRIARRDSWYENYPFYRVLLQVVLKILGCSSDRRLPRRLCPLRSGYDYYF